MQPRFMAEGEKGTGKLEGLTALVTGADPGVVRAVTLPVEPPRGASMCLPISPGTELYL